MKVFIVCGYGIPEDITKDKQYSTYLSLVFNALYSMARGEPALIIPSGGPTSCTSPYSGTEAEMIADALKALMAREATREAAREWIIIPETDALSTLENLVYAKRIIDENASGAEIVIFCEMTRKTRIEEVGKRIFGRALSQVEAIDFDVSANRYLDPARIEEKEQAETAGALWALESPERLAAHHELFVRKFKLLRDLQAKGVSHVEAVAEWYKVAPQWIDELMPGHPASTPNRQG